MESIKKSIITAFVLLNVSIMIVDGLPDQSTLGARFMQLVERYQALTMLYQPWAMFAPNPMNTTAFIEADLTFADGSTSTWKLPRPVNSSGLRKFLTADRYRIYGQETLLPGQNDLAWFDLARYITRQQMAKSPEGSPAITSIVFKRFSSRIQPPEEGRLIPHGTLSTRFEVEEVFKYTPTYKEVRHEASNNH